MAQQSSNRSPECHRQRVDNNSCWHIQSPFCCKSTVSCFSMASMESAFLLFARQFPVIYAPSVAGSLSQTHLFLLYQKRPLLSTEFPSAPLKVKNEILNSTFSPQNAHGIAYFISAAEQPCIQFFLPYSSVKLIRLFHFLSVFSREAMLYWYYIAKRRIPACMN